MDHNFAAIRTDLRAVQRDNGTQPTYTDPINPIFNAFSPQPSLTRSSAKTTVRTDGGKPDYPHRTVLQRAIWSAQLRCGTGGISYGNSFHPGACSPTWVVRIQLAPGPQCYPIPTHRRLQKNTAHTTLKFGVNFHRIDLTYLSYQAFQQGRITERTLADSTVAAARQFPAAAFPAGESKRRSRITISASTPGRMEGDPATQPDLDVARRPQLQSGVPDQLFRQPGGDRSTTDCTTRMFPITR